MPLSQALKEHQQLAHAKDLLDCDSDESYHQKKSEQGPKDEAVNQGNASTAQADELIETLDMKDVKAEQLQMAFAQFNRISKTFLDSYQSLEGEVDTLADRLAQEVRSKERELFEKESLNQRLHRLLAILPSGVIVLNRNGQVTDCNDVAIHLLGRPLLNEKWIDVIQRSFRPQNDDYEVSLKDGRLLHIETRSLDMEDGQIIVLTDITEMRKSQTIKLRDDRLKSMGRMMASLAHQIRTPLSTALLYASSLNRTTLDQESHDKFSNKLVQCLHHLESQVTQMLQFAKSGGMIRKNCSAAKVVDELIEFIQMNVKCNLSIQCETLNATMDVNIDALKSGVLNIINNALEAVGDDANKVNVEIFHSKHSLSIRVKDFGMGMSDDVKSSIFEPFFTTKESGNGLGLAVVQGVVMAHKGHIQVESQLGSGTEIIIDLPINEWSTAMLDEVR